MRYLLFISIFLLTNVLVYSQQNQEIYQKKLSILVKSSSIKNYYKIDQTGISIYANAYDKANGKVECKVYYDEVEAFKTLMQYLSYEKFVEYYKKKGENHLNVDYLSKFPDKTPKIPAAITPQVPLKGIRIALDPGHIAGSYQEGQFEWRCVTINNGNTKYYESHLAFATAKFLEDTLKKLGAEVFITKKELGLTAFEKTYNEWLKTDLDSSLKSELKAGRINAKQVSYYKRTTPLVVFHKYFNILDLRERARLINEFNPHFTIIMHYNVSTLAKRNKYGHYIPTSQNFNAAFVPGGFLYGELYALEARVEFLRLLLTDDLYNSIEFSSEVINSQTQKLNVPPANDNYIDRLVVNTNYEGVKARNLLMTRLVRGTICYGETLCQDNKFEAQKLGKNNIKIGTIYAPQRTQEVAYSYLDAILNYVHKQTQISYFLSDEK